MKFFIAMCVKEYEHDVCSLFKEAGISTYSTTDITGFKQNGDHNLLQEWFAAGDEKFDSVILFSFTTDVNVQHAKQLIKEYNEKQQAGFPVRAFVIPVEDAI